MEDWQFWVWGRVSFCSGGASVHFWRLNFGFKPNAELCLGSRKQERICEFPPLGFNALDVGLCEKGLILQESLGGVRTSSPIPTMKVSRFGS